MGMEKGKKKIKNIGIYLEPQIQIISSKNIKGSKLIKLVQYIITLIAFSSLTSCFVTGLDLPYIGESVTYNFVIFILFSLSFLVCSINKYKIVALSGYLIVYLIFAYEYMQEILNGFILVVNMFIDFYNQYYETNYLGYMTYGYDIEKTVSIFLVFLSGLTALLICYVLLNCRKYWIYIIICTPYIGFPLIVGRIPNNISIILFALSVISIFGLDSSKTKLNNRKLRRANLKDRNEYYNNKIKEQQFAEIISTKAQGILFFIGIVSFITALLIFPQRLYNENANTLAETKEKLINGIYNFDIGIFLSNFSLVRVSSGDSEATGGLGYGKLGNVDSVKFDNEPDLEIAMSREIINESDNIYLKGYTGHRYSNDSWTDTLDVRGRNRYKDLEIELKKNGWVEENQSSSMLEYISNYSEEHDYKIYNAQIKELDVKGGDYFLPYAPIMELKPNLREWNMEFDDSYKKNETYNIKFCLESTSYYEKMKKISQENYLGEELLKRLIDSGVGEIHNYIENELQYRNFVYETYTKLPENSCLETVKLIRDNNINGEPTNKVIEFIDNYLDEETEYSLSPGETPEDKDFVDYFLFENKKGYCVYYATAGVIMLRAAGIPARYAEGYIVKTSDIKNGKISGDEIIIPVPDANAHAWAEIYIDGYGWQPVEFTKGYEGGSNNQSPVPTESPNKTKNPINKPENTLDPINSSENPKLESSKPVNEEDSDNGKNNKGDNAKDKAIDTHEFLSKLLRGVFKIFIVLIIICVILFVRSRIIFTKRKRHFRICDIGKRTSFLYNESVNVIYNIIKDNSKEIQVNRKTEINENMLLENADLFERVLYKEPKGKVRTAVLYFMKSAYSNEGLNEDEFDYILKFYNNAVLKMYEHAENSEKPLLVKLYYKYIICY